jgi:hypothetical protein
VIPRKRLGSEFVPDFLIGDKNSAGYRWVAVELESPAAKMFNKNGDPSAALNHASRQILNWQHWLKKNLSYATNSIVENGLGLPDIDSDVEGLIIIGRRSSIPSDAKLLRRQLSLKLNIHFQSYDWLTDLAAQCFSHNASRREEPKSLRRPRRAR